MVEKSSYKVPIEKLLGSIVRVRILKFLALNTELTISQIIRKIGSNHSTSLKHLEFLKRADLVQEKKFGRIKIFRLKTENEKARILQDLIKIWENN